MSLIKKTNNREPNIKFRGPLENVNKWKEYKKKTPSNAPRNLPGT